MTDLRDPDQVAEAAARVRPSDLDGAVRISSDPERHVTWLRHDLERFDAVYVHDVGRDQRRFIDVFGRDVLPALR